MNETVIGKRRFVDGEVRVVYQGDDGKQFVFDDDLEPVYGVWILPADDTDEPFIVGIQ